MNNELKNFYKENQRKVIFNLSEESKARVKQRLLANLGLQEDIKALPQSKLERLSRLFLKSYVLVPLVCILFITGTAIASANSLPGDKLYGVKRQVEEMRLLTAPTEEKKLQLQIEFAQKRLEENQIVNNPDTIIKKDDLPSIEIIEPAQKEENDNQKNYKDETNINSDRKEDKTYTNIPLETPDKTKKQTTKEKTNIKSKAEAKEAIKFLNEIKQRYEKNGQTEKLKKIEEQIKKFEGTVKGVSDILEKKY